MASYKVIILPAAETEFRAVPFPFRRQLNQRLVRLKENPRPPDCQRLSEDEDYRLEVHGWIVLYSVDEGSTTVTLWAVHKA